MIDINDPKLIAAMECMDLRRKFVIEHCNMIADIFNDWQAALSGGGSWKGVASRIRSTVEFITTNRGMFSNYERHMDQYAMLAAVAKELA